jgi:hypothetical protein
MYNHVIGYLNALGNINHACSEATPMVAMILPKFNPNEHNNHEKKLPVS